MATIVLVHGIAQEQAGPRLLEQQWVPALADGVHAAQRERLAEAIWPDRTVQTRLAFYGDLFISPDQQGPGDSLDDLSDAELTIAEELAEIWLGTAARNASDERDREEAQLAAHAAARSREPDAQGRRILRAPMNALAKLRWFAPAAVALGGTLAWRALRQVPRYLADADIRSAAQQRVLDLIGPDTALVIGHSLGSVIAYEALHKVTPSAHQPIALITLGSPLGLRNVIYERLRPSPPHVPPCLGSWDNFVDLDDLVAAHINLEPCFPPAPGHDVKPRTHRSLDNGSQPHDISHYLVKRSVGETVAAALAADLVDE